MCDPCFLCGGETDENDWDTEFGRLHSERSDTCMTPLDEMRDADLSRLGQIKQEFSRKGYVNVDHFAWVVQKLTAEWEVYPPVGLELIKCVSCGGDMVCPHCTFHMFDENTRPMKKENKWATGKPCSCYWCRVSRGEVEGEPPLVAWDE